LDVKNTVDAIKKILETVKNAHKLIKKNLDIQKQEREWLPPKLIRDASGKILPTRGMLPPSKRWATSRRGYFLKIKMCVDLVRMQGYTFYHSDWTKEDDAENLKKALVACEMHDPVKGGDTLNDYIAAYKTWVPASFIEEFEQYMQCFCLLILEGLYPEQDPLCPPIDPKYSQMPARALQALFIQRAKDVRKEFPDESSLSSIGSELELASVATEDIDALTDEDEKESQRRHERKRIKLKGGKAVAALKAITRVDVIVENTQVKVFLNGIQNVKRFVQAITQHRYDRYSDYTSSDESSEDTCNNNSEGTPKGDAGKATTEILNDEASTMTKTSKNEASNESQ
jgi:hypothetical protein